MANRQTRRNESKKNNNKKKNTVAEEVKTTSDNTLNKIIIGLMVICILGLFYLLTVYITNKNTDKPDTEEKTESSVSFNYDEILVGKAFSMSDSDYVVVLYDPSISAVAEAVSTYKGSEDHLPIYTVDMTNTFNKKYVSEESNTTPSKASELSINGPTLLRITNNSLVDYIEGEEEINNYLN